LKEAEKLPEFAHLGNIVHRCRDLARLVVDDEVLLEASSGKGCTNMRNMLSPQANALEPALKSYNYFQRVLKYLV
jgi:hypothetical protein